MDLNDKLNDRKEYVFLKDFIQYKNMQEEFDQYCRALDEANPNKETKTNSERLVKDVKHYTDRIVKDVKDLE